MYNGIRNHKHLGVDWRCAVVAFASLVSVSQAEWTSDDLTYILNAIDDVHSEVYGIASIVGDWEVDLSQVESGIEDVNTELDTISSYLSSIDSRISDLPTFGLVDNILSELETIEASFELRERRQHRFEDVTTNRLNLLVVNTEATVDRLDTLLDYLTNQTFTAASFPTNYPASQISRFWTSDLIWDELRELYFSLYGRYPSEDEMYHFYDAFVYGNSQVFFDNLYSRIAYTDYLVDIPPLYLPVESLDEVFFNNSHVDDNVLELGSIYYAEYNTYDVTQYAASILGVMTNGFEQLPALEQSYDSYGNRVTKLDEDSSDTVGDLAESFTGTFGLEDSVEAPNTNRIENLRDDGYSSALAGISRESVLQDITADLSSSLSSMMQESQSYLIPTASADSFVLDFGSMSIFGSSGQSVKFTLTRAPAMYFRIIRIVTAVLKIVVSLGALYAIFHRVTSLDMS